MTRNEIEYQNFVEQRRSNLAKEQETAVHNRETESQGRRGLAETERSNRASESETHRSHVTNERLQFGQLLEQQRSNRENESLSAERNAVSQYAAQIGYAGALVSAEASRYMADARLEGQQYAADSSLLSQREGREVTKSEGAASRASQEKIAQNRNRADLFTTTYNTMLNNRAQAQRQSKSIQSQEGIAAANRQNEQEINAYNRANQTLNTVIKSFTDLLTHGGRENGKK